MEKDIVFEIFEKYLTSKGYSIKKIHEDGSVTLEIDGISITSNLENIRRNYIRDKDPDVVARFVDQLVSVSMPLPGWEEVRKDLYLSAEAGDYDFGNVIFEKVTDSICKVLVYCPKEEGKITWVDEAMLRDWGISREKVFEAAYSNMDRLMSQTRVSTAEVRGMNLGMLETFSPFKASQIFAPGLKKAVSEVIGWPVYAVIPARDFIFIFSEKDQALLNMVGSAVIKEYNESGYPITKEVIHISEFGIAAIGHY